MKDCIVINEDTSEIEFIYRKNYLLRPGSITSKKCCDPCSPNLGCSSYETFDIQNGKIILNVPKGDIHLIYYADNEVDGEQLIPDIFRVQEYIKQYIIYKLFEQIANQVTDETFNQVQQKMIYYKQLSEEAFIEASIEVKKQTLDQKRKAISKQKSRYNQYRFRG